jgi:hypothetical protein
MTTADERLSAALQAEYTAIFAYGVVGAHLDPTTVEQAHRAELVHRSRRDALIVQLTGNGVVPPGAEPAYTLPFEVKDKATAIKLAIQVEDLTAGFWREALGDTQSDARKMALDALINCAVQATRWRKLGGVAPSTIAWPGVPA